jgi:hypothetical protein
MSCCVPKTKILRVLLFDPPDNKCVAVVLRIYPDPLYVCPRDLPTLYVVRVRPPMSDAVMKPNQKPPSSPEAKKLRSRKCENHQKKTSLASCITTSMMQLALQIQPLECIDSQMARGVEVTMASGTRLHQPLNPVTQATPRDTLPLF